MARSRSKSPAPRRKQRASKVRRVFDELDANGDGTLDILEMEVALTKLGMSTEDLEDLFEEADADNSGYIDFDEYEAVITSSKPWTKVHVKTHQQIMAEILNAGADVMAPMHRAVRKGAAPAGVPGGHVKPTPGIRVVALLMQTLNPAFLPAGFIALIGGGIAGVMSTNGGDQAAAGLVIAFSFSFVAWLILVWFQAYLYARGQAHVGQYWMGLCVVDKKSGELKTGCFMYGYLLVHILTSTLFLIDIILMVAGGGDRIVDALLGTTVVCQQPVTKRD